MMFPLLSFDVIDSDEANDLLAKWQHKMGPIERPFPSRAYALYHNDAPIGLAVHACLIRDNAGGLDYLTRTTSIELARLCAYRPGICRIVLRMWRDFVFPNLNKRFAVSYQDSDLHNGNTYRFDGWKCVAESHSGTDRRSGRKGRNKKVWIWEA